MGWSSIFTRKAGPAERGDVSPATPDAVARVRIRARRRLIGAAVLIAIGVIGFPLLFESAPRPVPVDIPINIPRREAAQPLPMPAAPVRRNDTAAASAPPSVTAERSGSTTTVSASAGTASTHGSAAVAPAKPPVESAPAAAPSKPSATEAAAAGGAFVMQAGAFAEAGAAREQRQKLEQLGFKTFVQAAQTAAGYRVRVRVGPFATREEAEKAVAKARAAGIDAAVLTP